MLIAPKLHASLHLCAIQFLHEFVTLYLLIGHLSQAASITYIICSSGLMSTRCSSILSPSAKHPAASFALSKTIALSLYTQHLYVGLFPLITSYGIFSILSKVTLSSLASFATSVKTSCLSFLS